RFPQNPACLSGPWPIGHNETSRLPGSLFLRTTTQETPMDKEHVKGAADKAKGAVKEAAGKVTGDKGLEAEGKVDKVKGDAHKAVGDVKDAVKDATKH